MTGRMYVTFVDEVTQKEVGRTKEFVWKGETVEQCRVVQLKVLDELRALIASPLFGWDYNAGAVRDADFECHLNTIIRDEQTRKQLFRVQVELDEIDSVEKEAIEAMWSRIAV